MTDSDYFISESALNAPLCAFYPISSIDEPSQDNVADNTNSGDAKDTSSGRFYSTVELMELIEVLQVPFLYQNNDSALTPIVTVGTGGFSAIRRQTVRNWLDKKAEALEVAIKEFTSRQAIPSVNTPVATGTVSITQAYIEICVMKHPHLLDHPNITRLLGITDETIAKLPSDESNLCVVTEYADLSSLEAYLSRHSQQLDWSIKASLICDIANGLLALHACDIIHNDVKCGNILLFLPPSSNTKLVAKLCDFGGSVPLAVTNSLKRKAATQAFAAPEAYFASSEVLPSRDIYSLGLAILHIVTGNPPLLNTVPEEEIWDFKRGPGMIKYIAKCFGSATSTPIELKEVVLKMLAKDAKERLSNLSELIHLLADSSLYCPSCILAHHSLESTSMQVPPLEPVWLEHHLNLSDPTTSHELLETVNQSPRY